MSLANFLDLLLGATLFTAACCSVILFNRQLDRVLALKRRREREAADCTCSRHAHMDPRIRRSFKRHGVLSPCAEVEGSLGFRAVEIGGSVTE